MSWTRLSECLNRTDKTAECRLSGLATSCKSMLDCQAVLLKVVGSIPTTNLANRAVRPFNLLSKIFFYSTPHVEVIVAE